MAKQIINFKQVTKYYDNPSKPVIKNFNLTILQGEIVTFLGPSGCGKTTLLRLIAGFERNNEGTITINDIEVSSNSSWIPPEKRGIGMVFQDYALFPHLNVKDNLKFPLHSWDKPRKEERIKEVLELVGLSGYETRYPHELSGGQQQRVALARALAPKPNLILLDEPFSNLDAGLRSMMRKEIRNIIKKSGTTAIFVSHDQKDALSISDKIVVINKGEIEQIGTPEEVYKNPASKFVASFMGLTNIIEGVQLPLPLQTDSQDKEKLISIIRPEGITIDNESSVKAVIKEIDFMGDFYEILIGIPAAEKVGEVILTFRIGEKHDLMVGQQIGVSLNQSYISIIADKK